MRRAPVIATLLALGLLTSGCPVVRLNEVGIDAASTGPTEFVLEMKVNVTEDVKEDSVNDAGDPVRLRGIVGFWLPEGWEVRQTTIREAGAEDFVALHPVTKVVPFPRTFPHKQGAWWAFVTNCIHVPVGTLAYDVRVAVTVPEGTTGGNLGMIISQFEKTGNYSDTSPIEIVVDLPESSARVVEVDRGTLTPVNVSLGTDLGRCNKAKVGRGPRGCSCELTGNRASTSLFSLLLSGVLL